MHPICTSGRAVARVVQLLVATLGLHAGTASAAATPGPGPGPTVKEVIEFTRIYRRQFAPPDDLQGNVSPDGKRAFIITRNASVARDSLTYRILLLDVRSERLSRGKPDAPLSVFDLEVKLEGYDGFPAVNDLRWSDDHTLLFRGKLAGEAGPYQVYALDADTRRLKQLTFESEDVMSYALSADGSRLLYSHWVQNPPLKPGARSVVVGNQTLWAVKFGHLGVWQQQRRLQFAVADLIGGGPARPIGDVVRQIGVLSPPISISPDGRWALIPRFEESRHKEWAARYPLVGEIAKRWGTGPTIDPLAYHTAPQQWLARTHIAYRLSDGAAQPVLDAPDDATPSDPVRPDRMWARDGKSLVIAGVHLPVPNGSTDPGITASHVVEYWPDSGRHVVIARLGKRLESLQPVAGTGEGFVAVTEGERRAFLREADGSWKESPATAEATRPKTAPGVALADGWRLRIDQALNRPADIVADGPRGQSVRLTRLNPQFAPATWGSMRPYGWRDKEGRTWSGGLMVPSDYDSTRRYPVVIQTYGFDPDRFYLDGSNRSEGYVSGFAGRAFLREGMLVLALPTRADGAERPTNSERSALTAEATRSAIEALVAAGIADRDRIGIMGWSVTGETVLNALTFWDLPIRAASILDGDANTLFVNTIASGFTDPFTERIEQTNHGTPFGPGLKNWIAHDPSLNTECIRAAMRIESYGPNIQGNWDIYKLLRRQYKPADMVVFPGGAHGLGQPSDRMISLQGNVDWYRFWLKGQERADVVLLTETSDDLRQQYVRWRQMVELKKLDDAKPRCEALSTAR